MDCTLFWDMASVGLPKMQKQLRSAGSGLRRAAHMRGRISAGSCSNPAALATIILWRGKLLLDRIPVVRWHVCRLIIRSRLIAGDVRIFLSLDDGGPRLCRVPCRGWDPVLAERRHEPYFWTTITATSRHR
jgi:hypothetical protein